MYTYAHTAGNVYYIRVLSLLEPDWRRDENLLPTTKFKAILAEQEI